MAAHPDPELAILISDAIDAGLLKAGTRAQEVARLVASKGQSRLVAADRLVWETVVLPILAKPLATQIVLQTLAQRVNRLPRSTVV